MGVDRTIRFPIAETPQWVSICSQLRRVGETVMLKMIDGLPAFPDETPEGNWKELRVGTSAGMVTLRRGSGALTCIVWGNTDPSLESLWMKLIWACAAAGDGLVETPAGLVTSEQFAQSAGLSPP